MQQYHFNIILSNGNEVSAFVAASDVESALQRLKQTDEFINFVSDNTIIKITCVDQKNTKLNTSQFLLQKSKDNGYWVITDTIRNIVVKFKEHEFNNTQKCTYLYNTKNINAVEFASALREIGEYLMLNYSNNIINNRINYIFFNNEFWSVNTDTKPYRIPEPVWLNILDVAKYFANRITEIKGSNNFKKFAKLAEDIKKQLIKIDLDLNRL